MKNTNISLSDSIDNANIIDSINSTNRKLASVQRITAISDIQGADRISVAQVLGWQCVIAKKDNFKVGDLIIYIECDSILPERPEFEFLRERKFRVKIAKFKKQISEGLIMPLSILPDNANCYGPKEGDDLTDQLGIKKYDPEGKLEQALIEKEKRSPIMRFLMGIPAFRYVYLKLNTNVKGNWPIKFVGSKTDENRIQICLNLLMDHFNEKWYITEKLDGSSSSFFTFNKKVWGISKKCFGVCSRNIWLKTRNKSNYWEIAEKIKLEKKLIPLQDNYSLQGELIGEGIQANKYKISGKDLYIFNVIKNGVKLTLEQAKLFCEDNDLKFVPIICNNFIPSKEIGENKTPTDIVNFMVEFSRGKSKLFNRNREGIVCRLVNDPTISFKVINPDFLLEEKD